MTQPSFLPRAGETGPDDLLTLQTLPSVDALLNDAELQSRIRTHGRALIKRAIQRSLSTLRQSLTVAPEGTSGGKLSRSQLMRLIESHIVAEATPRLRRSFNLTGTVIHTNLGRSPLPEAAIDALEKLAA